MMKPGGAIYIQIPNKYGIDQLMKDHHYALTGITALSRPQAIEYWQLATGEAAEHVLWYAPAVSEMCKRLEKPIYPGLRPELEKRIRRRVTKVARLYAHASQTIIDLQDRQELAATACDSVTRRLCLGLWRFIGIKAGSE
jgi:hypothetical protein